MTEALTIDTLRNVMRAVERIRAPAPLRVVPTTALPMEHYADELAIVPFHPLWVWFERIVLRRQGAPTAYVLRGRPLYRPGPMYQIGDTIYCHPAQYAELCRRLG